MKAVILAGGYGARLDAESGIRPKPMVEIGGKPILWHIMKIYSAHGIHEFIICCGYKGYLIKEYFANYSLHMSDVTFDMRDNRMTVHQSYAEPWKVTLVDTGDGTRTGGRLKRVQDYLQEETFCMAYGDSVSNVDVGSLIRFHQAEKALATLTAVQPPGRFGAFNLEDNGGKISTFKEKPMGDGAWVNGGFFVIEPEALNYIDGDATVWEREPLEQLAQDGLVAAYRHDGYWQPMDTLRDKNVLDELWQSSKAPWKVW
jgi:glucose-1-phosphate cytidylyltransferase